MHASARGCRHIHCEREVLAASLALALRCGHASPDSSEACISVCMYMCYCPLFLVRFLSSPPLCSAPPCSAVLSSPVLRSALLPCAVLCCACAFTSPAWATRTAPEPRHRQGGSKWEGGHFSDNSTHFRDSTNMHLKGSTHTETCLPSMW